MTCAYLIQSHTNPAQILRLVRTIRAGSPHAPVLVLHDAAACPLDAGPFRALGGVEVILRAAPVVRAEFSMLDSLFGGIALLLGEVPGRPAWDFDWLVYLSGQDYPVRPLADLEASLRETELDGFLAHWGIDGSDPRSPWRPRQGERRYLCQYRRLPDGMRPLLRALRPLEAVTPLRLHLTYGAYLGWRPRRTPFDGPLRCYGGWQWWTLRRPCVEQLRRFFRGRPDVVRWFRRTSSPEEAFVQTALVNEGRFRLHPDNRRYADFRGSRDGRPRWLSSEDLPLLKSGAYDFARKFDAGRDPMLFDRIDAEILGLR